jgi:Transposase DDE domain
VGEEYLERVRTYQQTRAYQKALRKRQVWVEPMFAEAKDWHGLRRFRLRLLWRVNIEALRTAAGQNLKRLLKQRGWGRRPFPIEAMCASFLAVFMWFACPLMPEWSIPYWLVELNHWSEHQTTLFTAEFVKGLFQQAATFLIKSNSMDRLSLSVYMQERLYHQMTPPQTSLAPFTEMRRY